MLGEHSKAGGSIGVGGGGAAAGELQLQGPEIQDGALRQVEGYCVVGGHRFISKRDQLAGVAGDVGEPLSKVGQRAGEARGHIGVCAAHTWL